MRTISTADGQLLQPDSGRSAIVRVKVRDSGGTLRDLSTYPGQNFVLEAAWGEDVDANGLTATVKLRRGNDLLSLAPLHDTSPLNRAFVASNPFASLLAINRDIVIEAALLPDGALEAAATWREQFRGKIDSIDFGDEAISLSCRDQVAPLMDTWIEVERLYAFAQGGSATAGCRVFEPSATYALNELVVPTETKLNGYFFKVTTAGTAAASEPSWPTSGTVTSGGVVFTLQSTTSQSAGTPVETVLQQILNDNGLSSVTLSTPVSPGWNIRAYVQQRQSVWEALRVLATQIGWDLRFKWNGSSFVLTLSAPDRTGTTPLRTFNPVDVVEFSTARITAESIRNVVRVFYSDSQDKDADGVAKRKNITVTDSASVTAFGRRYMEMVEASSSNIDTGTEATTLANAALSDLSTPVFEGEPQLQFFPFVELGDLYRFTADGLRFTTSQDLGVIGYQHTINEGSASTSLTLRGKPSAGLYRWLGLAGEVTPDDVHLSVLPPGANTFALLAANVPGGVELALNANASKRNPKRKFEFHVSESAGFTPDSTTIIAATPARKIQVASLQPGATYKAKVISTGENDTRIIRSQPSDEITFTAGYVEAAHLNPETVAQPMPPNGSFEGYRRGTSYPPDHWSMYAGTWATDVVLLATGGAAGPSCLLWKLTTGVYGVQSAFFPVKAGAWYALAMSLKKYSTETQNVTLGIDWYDGSKSSISSSTFDTALSNYSSWGRVTRSFQAPSTALYARVRVHRATSSNYQFYVDAVEVLGSPDWEAASGWVNNWTDYGGGYSSTASTVTPDGIVRLRGFAKRSTGTAVAAEVMFVLPLGHRPASTKAFPVLTSAGYGSIGIDTSGNVQWLSGGYAYLSLESISFDTR